MATSDLKFATGTGRFKRFKKRALILLGVLIACVVYDVLAQFNYVPLSAWLRVQTPAQPGASTGAAITNELAKQVLQFLFATVLAGLLTAAWKHYDTRRQRCHDERNYVREIFARTRKAYEDTKLARRMLRIIDTSKNSLSVDKCRIEASLILPVSLCAEFLKILQASQLAFENLRREAALARYRMEEIFVDWSYLESSYSRVEKALRNVLKEFEESGREKDGKYVFPGNTKMFDFVKPDRTGFDAIADEMDQILDLITWVLASDGRAGRMIGKAR
jgi:hypothetical protein